MKRLYQLVAALALFVAILGIARPAQAYYCMQWDPLHISCLGYSVDLLPNARWCGNNPSPGVNEVIVYTKTGWDSSANAWDAHSWCQIITVPTTGTEIIPHLSTYNYNWQYHVASWWAGSNVQIGFWSGSFNGTYLPFNINAPYVQTYEGNTSADWGFYPESMAMSRH